MSMNAVYSGNLETPTHVALTGTSKTTIYTAPDRTKIIAGWTIVNPTGSPVNVEIYWNNGADRLIWRKAVAANDTAVAQDIAIRLGAGEIIKAVGANTVTVTLFTAMQLQTK